MVIFSHSWNQIGFRELNFPRIKNMASTSHKKNIPLSLKWQLMAQYRIGASLSGSQTRREVYRWVVNISSRSPTVIIKPIPTWTCTYFDSKMRYPPSKIQQNHFFTFQLSVPGLQNHTTGIYGILEKNTSCVPNLYTPYLFYILSVFFLHVDMCSVFVLNIIIYRNIQRL